MKDKGGIPFFVYVSIHARLPIMAMSKYPSMNWNALDVADTFKLYKQRLLLVCEDNDVTENERICRKIKIGVGDEGLRRLNASGLSDVEQKNPAKLVAV